MPPFPLDRALARRASAVAVALLSLLPGVTALASPPSEEYYEERYHAVPDITLAHYQRGALGVLMPFDRIYLYAAWRAITLGQPALAKAPNMDGGLLRAGGAMYVGWVDQKLLDTLAGKWQQSVAAALKQPALPAAPSLKQCPASSYSFATATLDGLAARADATAARLASWIDNQKKVFAACGGEPDDASESGKDQATLPDPGAAGPLYWQQQQQYQLAAQRFYRRDYGAAGALFEQIGQTAGHPQQHWGAYLALRAAVRDATSDDSSNDAELLGQLQERANRILRDPALAALHGATRAAMRTAASNLAPGEQMDMVSNALDDAHADPYVESSLGDWRLFANRAFSSGDLSPATRQEHGYLDWITAVQTCAYRERNTQCAGERAYALEQWERYSKQQAAGPARVWLVAALMLNDTWSPALLQAALAVPEAAPEYLTVRYRLVRHYRMAGQPGKARGVADPVLAGAQLKALDSARSSNLFLQERFDSATSLHDAAGYLLRRSRMLLDNDTGEAALPAPDGPRDMLGSDGLRWLNGHLALADLMQLAQDRQLGAGLRANIAVAAWMRAELLDLPVLAGQAAQLAATLAPALAPGARRYQQIADAKERRYWLLVDAQGLQLAPVVDGAERPKKGSAQGGWCGIGDKQEATQATPDQPIDRETLALPKVSTDPAGAARQLAGLEKMANSGELIGKQVLWRATTKPDDPDLPRMLHQVVRASRYGCYNGGASSVSKQAFQLLHKRYPRNEWAKKTPYYYDNY